MLSQRTTASYPVENMTTIRGGSRTTCLAGEIAQCDFWFPPIRLPVGFGQTRTLSQLPVLTMITGYAPVGACSAAGDPPGGGFMPAGGGCCTAGAALPARPDLHLPTDFKIQLQAWLGMANHRRSAPWVAPSGADRRGQGGNAGVVAGAANRRVENTLRLPRDHYVRLTATTTRCIRRRWVAGSWSAPI